MNMYKEVPENFHRQFMDTLEQLSLEEKEQSEAGRLLSSSSRSKRYSPRRMAILIAAIIMVLSTVTVGAAELFKWRKEVRESLGVSEDLANQLTMNGVAKEEEAQSTGYGLEIEALQSVRTHNYYYILLSVETDQDIKLNEDTLFEEILISTGPEFDGCTINQVTNSGMDGKSLWEVQLLAKDGVDYAGEEVSLLIRNLIQTKQSQLTEVLVEGQWNLTFNLPKETDRAVLEKEKELSLGHHTISISRVEADPFFVRLYGKKEELQHALRHQNEVVAGIAYHDGTVIEEEASINMTALHLDEETKETYIGIPLTNAIDVTKFAEIILENAPQEYVEENPVHVERVKLEQMEVLYEKLGHRIVWDENRIYLWDMSCDYVKVLVELSALHFEQDGGGTVQVGPDGKTLQVLPNKDSKIQYVVEVFYDPGEEYIYEVAVE